MFNAKYYSDTDEHTDEQMDENRDEGLNDKTYTSSDRLRMYVV